MFIDEVKGLDHDEKTVFLTIQRSGPLTKRELGDRLSYKPSKLNRLIITLLERGLISQVGQQSLDVGRRPSLFDVVSDGIYLLGVDISRTRITAVLCDIKMKVIDSCSRLVGPEVPDQRPEVLLPAFSGDIKAMMAKNAVDISSVLGLGVAMVGPVDYVTGVTGKVLGFPTEGWSGLDVRESFARHFDCPVYVDNGTYEAVLYENLYGAGRGYNNVAFVNLGFSIRAGFISSGVIIRSANNDESSFAHTTLTPMGERCTCGKRGCVCRYATTESIFRDIRKRIAAGQPSLIEKPIDKIFFHDVVSAAEKGDESCRQELISAGRSLGYALANYITLLNPEVVILNGMAAFASEDYYDTAMRTALGNIMPGNPLPKMVRGGSCLQKTLAVSAAAAIFEKIVRTPGED